MTTVSSRLVDFFHGLAFEDLPEAVVEKAKLLVLDTVGICIGSTQYQFGTSATALAESWGGKAQCTAIGGQQRLPAQHAAFVNGVLAHGQDYDDTHTGSLVHSSGILVPATLAAAERDDSPGRLAIVALAGGTEAAIRLALPAHHRFSHRGFQTSTAVGTFGAALISAKTAGFDAMQMTQALGIGGSVTSGLMECIPAAASTKQLHLGWAALCGFMATEFARAGFTGPATVFEGKLGLYNALLHGETVEMQEIFQGIGESWEMLEIRPKLYPCGHPLNAFIDCAAALRREGKAPLDAIDSILCEPAQGSLSMICEPWDKKLAPASGYDARFSLPYAVAVMLARGKAGIEEFEDHALADPLVQRTMRKITYRGNPDFEVKDMPARITVRLADGTEHQHEIPRLRGDTANPIPTETLLEKFHANTAMLPRSAAEQIAETILQLDRVDSMRTMMEAIGTATQLPPRLMGGLRARA